MDANERETNRRERIGPSGLRELALADQATEQLGVVSRGQLLELGFTDDDIYGRVLRGRLHRLGPSVFAVGHAAISRLGQGMAALLHAGPNSGLSFDTAARIWGMVSAATDGPIHVSVRNRSRLVAPSNVVIHRPTTLQATDIVDHRGLRLTTPERTLVDRLTGCSVAQTTRMLEQMVTTLGRSPDSLHEWATGLHGTPGKSKLLRALDEVAGPAVIRSEFESRFRSVCQEAGVSAAKTNVRIGTWEVDAVWVDERVAVELDSWRFHGGKWQFYRDRRKGLAISRAGFALLRITWPQLKHERDEVVDAVRHAVARGGWRRAYELGKWPALTAPGR